mgnify:CR=1 FL=1
MTAGTRTSSLIPYSNYPSQNLVDAFETVNGYKVTLENTGWVCEDPAFDPQSPYENRDKRFYRAILANGMSFKDYTIETFKGGAGRRNRITRRFTDRILPAQVHSGSY